MHETLNPPNTRCVWRKSLLRAANGYGSSCKPSLPRAFYQSRVYRIEVFDLLISLVTPQKHSDWETASRTGDLILDIHCSPREYE